MADQQIDILIRLLADQTGVKLTTAEAKRALADAGKAGERAGKQIRKGFDDAKQGSQGLVRSLVDVKAALGEVNKIASQVGGLGLLGARNRDTAESFDFMAKRAGLSSKELISAMKKAAGGTVNSNAIMMTSNMVLGSRFKTSVEDMAKMMEFARLKGKQFGRTTEEAFQRITFGAVKSEVEFLDELGITIKLNDALKIYAESLGVSTKALNGTQRSQAIWNALLISADKELAEVPGGVKKATDAYEKFGVLVTDTTIKVGEFVDRMGIGPVMSIASQAIQTLTPMLTMMILLKQQAAAASAAHTAALGAETAAMNAQSAAAARGGARGAMGAGLGAGKAALMAQATPLLTIAAGVTSGVVAGAVAYDKVFAPLGRSIGLATPPLRMFTDVAGYAAREMLHGKEAADEWMRANLGMPSLAELSAKAQEKNAEAVKLSQGAYSAYVTEIQRVNTELERGETATAMMTQRQYELERVLAAADNRTRAYAEHIEQAADGTKAWGKFLLFAAEAGKKQADVEDEAIRKGKAALPGAAGIAKTGLSGAGLPPEQLKRKQDELNIALGKTTREQIQTRDTLELLSKAYAQGSITAEEFKKKIDEASAGLLKMTQAERRAMEASVAARQQQAEMKALLSERLQLKTQELVLTLQSNRALVQAEREGARAIADIQRKAAQERARALEQLNSALANAARAHAQRRQDIERNFQRRMRDIGRNFSRTAREASINRDAIALFQAQQTRDDQERDATEGRDEAQAAEGRSYAEQVRASKEAYQTRLRDIAASHQEELRRERETQSRRIQMQANAQNVELRSLQAHLRRVESEYRAHLSRMSAMQGGRTPTTRPGGRGVPDRRQAGGSGIVTGPHEFIIEPGVTESFWFSGAQNGRGGGAAMQAAPQQINVGGSVAIQLQGDLLERIQSEVAGPLGQSIVDSISDAFRQSTRR